MGRQNPNQNRKNSSTKKEQFAVRLSPQRARVIRTHLNLYEDATRADALRAAVDALSAQHSDSSTDASRQKFRDHEPSGGLSGGPSTSGEAASTTDSDLPPEVAELIDDDSTDNTLGP